MRLLLLTLLVAQVVLLVAAVASLPRWAARPPSAPALRPLRPRAS